MPKKRRPARGGGSRPHSAGSGRSAGRAAKPPRSDPRSRAADPTKPARTIGGTLEPGEARRLTAGANRLGGARRLSGATAMPVGTAGAVRGRVERLSHEPLTALARLPRPLVPLALAVVLGVGLLVRGPVGMVLLLLVVAVLAWLAYLSWPRLGQRARLLRLLMLGLLGGVVLAEAFQ